jgi:hypothetical protein
MIPDQIVIWSCVVMLISLAMVCASGAILVVSMLLKSIWEWVKR